jgi:geranylgeranyl reductase family protein
MQYDVVIVGTGPAGGMAACRLAATGASVLLLDRARLPRVKPCGGGLSPVVEKVIDWDFSALVQARIGATRSLLNYERPHTSTTPATLLMVNRRDFDLHLVERALRLGGGRIELRDGCEVAGVEEDSDGVTVSAGGERIRTRYVIGADGALGRTARSLGLGRRRRAAGTLDAEIEVDPEVFEAQAGYATFNYACVTGGYGWTFPKAGYLSCGVGSWGGRVQLPAAMDEYLRRSFPAGSIRAETRWGHPIPVWAGHTPVATPRVCLVGDAASLVDPVMGEGIRFALLSGRAAAEVILTLLGEYAEPTEAAAPTDCRAYGRRIEKGIGAEFEALRRFVLPMILRTPELFYRQFVEEERSYFSLARAMSARFDAATSSASSVMNLNASRRSA